MSADARRIGTVSAPARWTLICPECGGELVVDSATGAIVSHRPAKAAPGPAKSFDSLFADLDAQKAKAEDLFAREKAAYEDRDRLLDEKFKEAMKRAESEPDVPLKRPFDLD